ncbi:enolase-phosphatase E1-like isoform X2 [Gigantopelta aegis]|uniref:enolase-phosphatase E1-like isoform X2 n=1 Tax=Gigantopelta aegis TaxID=1735272 RepID=UPI001B888351|nr:enolase-phosphatase E1-like isoform X2 [Gigantopelta aegis]
MDRCTGRNRDTLFKYVLDNLESYVMKHYDDTELQKDIAALRELSKKDKEANTEGVVEIPNGDGSKDEIVKGVCENVKWQMKQDRKSTELKQLQGHIFKEAYKNGGVSAELFEDVAPVLRQLFDEGLQLYVFSSGSVEAQKLFFAHTSDGDLTDVFSGYYDTTVGGKTESSSYKTITTEIGNEPDEILFLTDTPEEASAAVEAGIRSTLVIRPGNEDLTDEHLQNFSCIERFDELFGDEDDEEDLKRFHGEGDGECDDDDDDEPEEEEEEQDEENAEDA